MPQTRLRSPPARPAPSAVAADAGRASHTPAPAPCPFGKRLSRTATMPDTPPTNKRGCPRPTPRLPSPGLRTTVPWSRRVAFGLGPALTVHRHISRLLSQRAPFAMHASTFVRWRVRDCVVRAADDASTGAKGTRVQPNDQVQRAGATVVDAPTELGCAGSAATAS